MQGGTSVENSEQRSRIETRPKENAGTYLGPRDNARLEHHLRFRAKVLGFPEDEVGDFAHFDRSNVCADAMRDRTIAS